MSFIFDATKPISPERQKIAKAMLERRQAEGVSPMSMPQDIGSGVAAFGAGIADGLEMRALDNQAKAPIDAWGDMRQVGTPQPTMQNMSQPFGAVAPMGSFFSGVRKLFG